MSKVYRCDRKQCGMILEGNSKRSLTIGSRSFDLCPSHKEEFEDFLQEFMENPQTFKILDVRLEQVKPNMI